MQYIDFDLRAVAMILLEITLGSLSGLGFGILQSRREQI
jgi:hypothetical protein